MAHHSLQKPQQGEGTVDIADLYDEAIEATIAQCKLLQNAKVLAAIEKQWRQSLRRKQAELKRAAAAREDSAAAAASRSSLSGTEQGPSSAPSVSSVPSDATDGGPSTDASLGVSAATAGTAEAPSHAPGVPAASGGGAEDTKAETAEDTDDEFADAEVDEAEEGPPVLGVRGPLDAGGKNQQNPAAESATNGGVEAPAQQGPRKQTVGENGSEQDDSDEDNEEGAGMTLDDVSDLDDREPPTTDGIFAFYEKVERAAAGAARRSSKWKVLLRHGILRVGEREIPFDRITSEFSF